MFGEISIWVWMGAAVMFGIGGGTGFFISRQLKDKRTRELEEKLEVVRNELSSYQGDVNQHFLKTSLLVSKLTNDYREVYEHLATGAQKLCYEKPHMQKLDLPEKKILPTKDSVEASAIELTDDSAEKQTDRKTHAEQEDGITTETSSAYENEQVQDTISEDMNTEKTAEAASSSTTENVIENTNSDRPSPEDIPDNEGNEEDVHLGAESAPSVENKPYKRHPSIH